MTNNVFIKESSTCSDTFSSKYSIHYICHVYFFRILPSFTEIFVSKGFSLFEVSNHLSSTDWKGEVPLRCVSYSFGPTEMTKFLESLTPPFLFWKTEYTINRVFFLTQYPGEKYPDVLKHGYYFFTE